MWTLLLFFSLGAGKTSNAMIRGFETRAACEKAAPALADAVEKAMNAKESYWTCTPAEK